MQINKAFSYVGFAIKANKTVFGTDSLLGYSKKIHLIIASAALSENALKKIEKLGELKKCPIIKLNETEFDNTVNKTGCKVVGITSFELASAIRKCFE